VKILVTFALEPEFAPWRRIRSFGSSSGSVFAAYDGQIGEAKVRVVLTGVGAPNARRVVRQALADAPDACIVSGLAGSLNPIHQPGDVLAAAAVREERGTLTLPSDAVLAELAVMLGARRAPMFLAVNRVLFKAEEKKRLSLAGDAVDMESFAAMAEAVERNVPAIAIRAISDAADEDLPLDFNSILNERGEIQLSRVLGRLALAPHRLPALLRLGQSSRRAAEKLARFLEAYIEHLSNRAQCSERLAETVAV
jgi:adenosylhomocysteine nucleosidase